jgi:hypothetical protein
MRDSERGSEADHESDWETESGTESESDHESDWEIDSEPASDVEDRHLEASSTADRIANDAKEPTSRTTGGEFSYMLNESNRRMLQDQRANNAAVLEHREDFGISKDWRTTIIRWTQRHVDCMELLQRIHGKHDYDSQPDSAPTGESITYLVRVMVKYKSDKGKKCSKSSLCNGISALCRA